MSHVRLLLITMSCCVVSALAQAACVEPYNPPRSPYYCTTSDPIQQAACRNAAEQFHRQEEATYRAQWEQRRRTCEAQEHAAEAQRAAAARREAEEVERRRRAAENDRYIAEQRAKQAAAEGEYKQSSGESNAVQPVPAANLPWKISAGWAWILVVLPLIGILKMVLTEEAPARVKLAVTFVVPLMTSLIGWSLGFTNDVTLAEFALLQAPSGAGLFVALVAKTA